MSRVQDIEEGAGLDMGPGPDNRAEPAFKRLIWVMLLRVGLVSALLGATLVLNYGTLSSLQSPSPVFLLSLVAATYLATIVYALWYRTGRMIKLLMWVQLCTDSFLWGCLAYATGGIASGFTFLFDLWVIVAAAVVGGRAAFVSAGISAVVLLMLSMLMWVGLLPPLEDQVDSALNLQSTLYFLGVNVVGLFVVAALVTSLVSRLERTGQGLERERLKRADLAALHSDIIRSLDNGLVTTGQKGEILSMNPSGLALLKLTAEQVEDAGISTWIPELSRVLEVGGAVDARGRGVATASDGKRIPVEYTVTPLMGADGRPRGSIVLFNDLSKVKKLEADLERARKLAALGQLGASLAHEIRNPLSAVYGSFQMLASRPDFNDEERSLSDIVLRELKRMERLVNDMLEYTRPRDPDRRTVDLKRMVEEIVRAFSVSKEAEGRSTELLVSEEEATARVDQGQIRQVLWNLLLNSAQATEDGGAIVVSVEMEPGGVEIRVEDDGEGIPDENRRKVFDPFFSRKERGLGLGLAICARIVEAHGGLIEAEQGGLGGASIRVHLPRGTSSLASRGPVP